MSTTEAGRPRTAGVPPRAARFYIALVVVFAIVVALLGWQVVPLTAADLPGLVVLCALRIVGAGVGRHRLGERYSLDFSIIVLVAAVAVVGPFGAAIVGISRSLIGLAQRVSYARVFNSAMASCLGGIGGLVYVVVGGQTLPMSRSMPGGPYEIPGLSTPQDLLVHIGLPLLLADVAICLLNAVMLAGIIRLTDDTAKLRRTIVGQLTSFGVAYVGYGIMGFLFVILWWPAELNIFSAVLMLPPLFVANYAFAQYADERNAHERTLSALVSAVEVKDVATRGHSDRVAQLCRLMASPLALSQQETEALRYAGLLHDIGKLSIPTTILRKVDLPTDDDLAAIVQHPARGLDILRDIEFLQDSVDGILHHHERYDGRGYPAGLAGGAIPLFARIIAVADAFDSLTTAKVGREPLPVDRALVELHRRSGSQLDGSVVVALERALVRHTWVPAALDYDALATGGRAFDHDDPAVSDLMASRASALRRRVATTVRARSSR